MNLKGVGVGEGTAELIAGQEEVWVAQGPRTCSKHLRWRQSRGMEPRDLRHVRTDLNCRTASWYQRTMLKGRSQACMLPGTPCPPLPASRAPCPAEEDSTSPRRAIVAGRAWGVNSFLHSTLGNGSPCGQLFPCLKGYLIISTGL